MTLLKDNNAKNINVALLSLEADIKKLNNNSSITSQLADINKRIDEINKGSGGSVDDDEVKADIKNIKNDIVVINTDITNINTDIDNIEQQLSNIFTAENKTTDFNATTNSGIYYWATDTANRPGTNYGVLLVNKYATWINQIAYGTNGKIYFRQNINSGNWTEWKTIAYLDEVNATLTVNGKTYNGSKAVDAGVQTVANGGTGVTTQADINKAFIGNLDVGTSDVTDGTEFVSSWASDNGFAETNWGALNKPYKRKFSTVWNYIKGKISSVLGLTKDNYGGNAATATTADKVASAGASGVWINGRANAICKTTSAGENARWKTLASIKTSSGSIEIGNLANEDYIRIVYSSDADVNAGINNVTQLLYIRKGGIETPHEFIANSSKASSKMVIPIGAPSSLENGCIWIG